MRPKYFAGIIIGILLLYLGFMGANGVGLTFTSATSLPTVENFNDLGGWASYTNGGGVTPLITPPGQLQLQAGPANGGDDKSAIRSGQETPGAAMDTAAPSGITVILKMAVDNWGQGGCLGIQLYTTSWYTVVTIYAGKVVSGASASVTWTHSLDTSLHTYTMAITVNSLTFYVDGASLGTERDFAAGPGAQYAGISLDASNAMLCHIDSVEVDAGINNPVPPTGYTLTINAQDSSGSALAVPMTVNGIGPRTTPTTPAFGPFTPGTVQVVAPTAITVNSVSYTFTDWTDGSTSATRSYDLESATTLTAVYTSGGNGPIPTPSGNGGPQPPPWNITAFISGILNNSSVRELEMAVGGLTAVISGIVFILPEQKRNYYSPAPPPGYR